MNMADYSVSDYAIFDNAIATAKKLSEEVNSVKTTATTCKTTLSNDAVFMGPIADACVEALGTVDGKLSTSISNLSTVSSYLSTTSANYKAGDTNAANQVLNVGKNSSLSTGTKGGLVANESDLPTITIDQVRSCENVSEYLNLVMPVYTFYCNKYGIKYPGVLALQPVHEHSAPKGISAQSAVEDNNLGGLKYAPSIPNATPGSYPTDGTGGQYSRFNNINEYIEAAC